MRIAIDISPIIYGSGVSVYTKNLVDALIKLDDKNEYLLFGYSLRRKDEIETQLRQWRQTANEGSGLEIKAFSIPPTFADWLWNFFHFLPIDSLIGKVDVFHSSDWVQPPSSAAKVTTIHDLAFLRWPESVHPKVLAAQRRRLERVKNDRVQIIAVSEATKKDVITLLGIPSKTISVVYEGVPEDAIKFAKSHQNTNILNELKLKHGINKPYFLAYGSSAPRKNIGKIVQAFEKFNTENKYQLVVVGEYRPSFKLSEAVIFTGFLKRLEMLSLFSGSEMLVFASIYEGFGLPILEAFVLKVPVVSSNISSMPEVAGSAAVLVDPYQVDSIAEGIKEALKNKQKLIKAGLAQSKKFSWEKTAFQTLEVYRNLK